MSREKDKMKNRDTPARPLFDNCGFPTRIDNNISCSGLTKLEYVAIQILQGAVTDNGLVNPVEYAINLANKLFDELEKQEQGE